MLEPTFNGKNIAPNGGNNNLAQLNDPKINAAMDKASTLQGDARNKAWADIDKHDHRRRARRPVRSGTRRPSSGPRTSTGSATAYYDALDSRFTSLK